MEEAVVLYEKIGQIAKITLNRPKALNAMNGELVSTLASRLDDAGNDNDVRVIILTGNGKGFCAGGDLAYLKQLTNVIEARAFITEVGALVKQIQSIAKPIIAMVNGVAAGAGFNLALACDIVFASDTARFAQSFVKVGLVPDCGGMYLLPKIVGMHKAKELMFTADLIGAAKADELGLLNRVIESDKLEAETLAFAEKLLLSAPIALGMVKQTLNGMEDMTLENWLVHEADMQTLCMQTKDHQEGISAFLEKRAPEFKNQ